MKRIIFTLLLALAVLTSCADPDSVVKTPSDTSAPPAKDSIVDSAKNETTEPFDSETSNNIPTKQVLFSDKGIEVEFVGLEEKGFIGFVGPNPQVTAELKVTNNTDEKVAITYFITAVNDFSMYGGGDDTADISAGESICVKPWIFRSDLNEQLVSVVNSIDIAFNVFVDADIIVDNENLRIQINDEKDLDIEEKEIYNKDGFRFFIYRLGESEPLFCFENNNSDYAAVFPISAEVDGKTLDITEMTHPSYTTIPKGGKVVLDLFSLRYGQEQNFFIKYADSDIVMSFEILLDDGENVTSYITDPITIKMK